MSLPARPDPPVVGKVTHNSIELYWTPPDNLSPSSPRGDDRLRYCVQEEEVGSRSKGFGNVYSGYSISNVFTGLEPRSQYRYRLRCMNNSGNSAWSVVVSVTTTRKPKTSEDLLKAVAKRDLETVKKTLPELSWQAVDSPDKFGISPLMVCAQKGYVDIAQTLLEHKADVRYQNSSGKTALMMACYSGQLEMVKVLRAHGASWDTIDKTGSTALHWAVDGANLDVLRWMMADGCQVDVKDNTSGWTPLMRVAATSGNANVAKILIHHGAKVNSMDRDSKTVLMNAALNGFEPLVKVLVKKGALILQKSDHGKTALDFARSFEHENVVKFLQEQMDLWKTSEKQRKLDEAMSDLKKQDNKTNKQLEDYPKENVSVNGHP